MKLSPIEKRSMIISIVFNILVIIGFSFLGFTHSYGKFQDIEENKLKLENIIDDISSIEKKGISFSDFNSMKSKTVFKKTEFLDSVLKNMKKSFYDKNFLNEKESSFSIFLDKKSNSFFDNDKLLSFSDKELSELPYDVEQKVRKEKLRNENIITILPSYNPDLDTVNEDMLTDFKFVNYMESIIRTFDLKSINKVGISSIVPYFKKDTKSNKDKNSKGNAQIFYIPISFNLVGFKDNIINFLHYVGNVGNIEIRDSDFEVLDDLFLKKGKKIILKSDYNNLFGNGSKYKDLYENFDSVKNYNIYNNQIIDIESISFKEYPISYYRESDRDKTIPFINFIRESQKNNRMEISLKLRFYIKGIPNYKKIDFIKLYISDYRDIKKQVLNKLQYFSENTEILKEGDNILLKNQFEKTNSYLNSISPDIKKFESSLKSSKSLDINYNRVLKYKKILKNISSVLLLDKSLDKN